MSERSHTQEWTTRGERGSLPLLKFGVWIALRLGRPLARVFLYPICLYFLVTTPKSGRDSRRYLARALGRRPAIADVFRHFLTFASCVLDRVFLLNDQADQFDIRIHGEEIIREVQQRGGGCLLFGAHFGSFEVARTIGRHQRGLQIALVMYEENARKIRAALAAINPGHETEVIGLGRADSLIAVAERLNRGHIVGLLADRNFESRDLARYSFLGAPAAFPQGPFRAAMLLKKPVVMMVGIYRGANRYDIFFESLIDPLESRPRDEATWLDGAMLRYVARLEHYCREAPFNWFNFFDFWA
jgi:predicted LPLAT superfamily acyltransferase